MPTAEEITLGLFTNPLRIQSQIVDDLQNTVLGGRKVMDPNNVFTFLMETAATITAGYATETQNILHNLYPYRANTMNALYRHMSDFDYAHLYSTPASTKVTLFFERNWLINNCVEVDTNTDTTVDVEKTTDVSVGKITLPTSTKIQIGQFQFGIHYPVDIFVRKVYKVKADSQGHVSTVVDAPNCSFSAQFNTSVANPLLTIDTNLLEVRNMVRDNLELVGIVVPCYQFTAVSYEDDAVSAAGFAKRYGYTDRFYAVRVFHYMEGTWQEMHQTLSDFVYDVDQVTAYVKVLTDMDQIEIRIPQIYFTKGMMGSRVRVVVYSTLGEMNEDISSLPLTDLQTSFLADDQMTILDSYNEPLRRVPYIVTVPRERKIISGSNGLSFDELRNRILHDSTYSVLITAMDVAAYFKDQGFLSKKYVDNITNRIYLALKTIRDNTDSIIGAGQFDTVFKADMLQTVEENGQLVSKNYRQSQVPISPKEFMVLPSAVYKYDADADTMTLLSDQEMTELDNLPVKDKLTRLNSNVYTFSPFHMKFTVNDKWPLAGSYNLMNPFVRDIRFKSPVSSIAPDNDSVATQLSVHSATFSHLNNGTGGYRLLLTLYRTQDIQNVFVEEGDDNSIKNIQVVLTTKASSGETVYMLGEYMGRTVGDDQKINFIFNFQTDYRIDDEDNIHITNLYNIVTEKAGCYLPLQGVEDGFSIQVYIREEALPYDSYSDPFPVGYRPTAVQLDYVWLASQCMTLTFGESLNFILNNVHCTINEEGYKKYPTTVFATYQTDVFRRYTEDDVDGTTVKPSMVGQLVFPLEYLHHKGDVVLSSTSENTFNQLLTFSDDAESIHTLELISTPTARSSDANRWKTVARMLMVISCGMPELLGRYTLANPTATDGARIWSRSVGPVSYTVSYETEKWLLKRDDTVLFEAEGDADVDTIQELVWIPSAGVDETTSTPVVVSLNDQDVEYTIETVDLLDYILDSDVPSFSDVQNASRNGSLYDGVFFYEPEARGSEFIFVGDCVLDDRPAENTFLEGNGAIYRRDWSLFNYDFTSVLPTTERLSALLTDLTSLKKLDLDESDVTVTNLATKYSLTPAKIVEVNRARFPWIKLMTVSSLEDLQAYADSRQIQGISLNDCKHYREVVANAREYASISAFSTRVSNPPENSLVYITDVTDAQAANPVFGAYPTGDTPTGAIFVYQNNRLATCLLRTTSFDNARIYFETMLGVSSGYAILIKKEGETIYHAIPNWNLDIETSWWSFVDKWPWEISEWLDPSGRVAKDVSVAIEERLSSTIIVQDSRDNMLDGDGNPIVDVDNPRSINAIVSMPHFDYKLLQSDETVYENFRASLIETLNSYFSTLSIAKTSLLEKVDLFYQPIKTIGRSVFKTTDAEEIVHDLDVGLKFRLHVESYVAADLTLKQQIQDTVEDMVEYAMASGSLSMTDIASRIMTALSETVLHVDILGIDGDLNLQTIVHEGADVIPHIRQKLVQLEDGSLAIRKDIVIEWSVLR